MFSTAAGAVSLKNLTKHKEVRKGADQAKYNSLERRENGATKCGNSNG